jgi:hypothetical protein
MSETRLRGQEVSIRLARGGVVEDEVTAIKDLTVTFETATISEGYLGETTMRQDMIFNGISGSFTVDAESNDLLTLIEFIQANATRERSPNVARVNLTARFSFPNGQTPRVIVRDLQFDSIPLNVPSRDAYVNVAFSFKAENARILTT